MHPFDLMQLFELFPAGTQRALAAGTLLFWYQSNFNRDTANIWFREKQVVY